MNILDFTTSKRAYMLYHCLGDTHQYSIIPQYANDIVDIRKYCPEVVKSIIQIDDIPYKKFDVIILHTCSILYREYDKKLIKILNRFKGKIFCVDYAWEGALHKRIKMNKMFKKKISGMGIAIHTSCTDIKPFPYSQPELDIFANIGKFKNAQSVIDLYRLPENMIYILVTAQPKSYSSPDKIKNFIRFIKEHFDLDKICIIWKLKEDHGSCYKTAKRYLKKNIPHYKIVMKQPDNPKGAKTFRDLISPIGELCLITDCHINISPLSYAQIETVRAGIPTYFFNKRGISSVDYVDEFKREIWTDESFDRYSTFRAEKSRCLLKVPNNYCVMNFIRNIEREIND